MGYRIARFTPPGVGCGNVRVGGVASGAAGVTKNVLCSGPTSRKAMPLSGAPLHAATPKIKTNKVSARIIHTSGSLLRSYRKAQARSRRFLLVVSQKGQTDCPSKDGDISDVEGIGVIDPAA